MRIIEGYKGGRGTPQRKLAAFRDLPPIPEQLEDGIDWPASGDVPPEYLGEPMALWSQALIPPGGTVPFQTEALRNPYDDAFFEVHGVNLSLANPNAAGAAILTLASLGLSLGLADTTDSVRYTITKDFVPANMLFGQRGAPYSTPYQVPAGPAGVTLPYTTIQIRFPHPWLVPPRWSLQAAAASRSASVQQAVVADICFTGRKVPFDAIDGSRTRLPYHCGHQFVAIPAGSSGETISVPADLMNVTDQDVVVTSVIGAFTQFTGATYGYGAFDIFPAATGRQYATANPAAQVTVGLLGSDGYPVIPAQTPVRVAFPLAGNDWPVRFTLRPKDYLIAQQNITLQAAVETGDPLAAAVSVGLAGWREVSL